MGCEGLFYTLLINFSVALLTYNIIISAPLKQGFPGTGNLSSYSSPRLFSVGPIIRMPADRSKPTSGKRLFHTAVTASDSVYNTWQCRIMYYWFKKFKDGPNSEMGGFTRILHSGKPDKFMDEIPTFVAQPLPSGMDQGYIVLNRPWAFVQWLQKAHIEEDYILMAEPDHIIVKPIPNLSRDGLGAAFPFFYIEPKRYESTLRKFFPVDKGPITNINPIGNSPVIVGKASLEKIAPTWMNISLAMKKDPETDKAFGWVLEMYAYAVSSALHGVGNILYKDFMIQVHVWQSILKLYISRMGNLLTSHRICLYERVFLTLVLHDTFFVTLKSKKHFPVFLKLKPPWDTEVGKKFIIHYTYGCDFDMKGKLTYGKNGEWRFDKRSYDHIPPPKNLALPPPGVPESVVTLVKMVNEATANIPNWGT